LYKNDANKVVGAFLINSFCIIKGSEELYRIAICDDKEAILETVEKKLKIVLGEIDVYSDSSEPFAR